MYISSGISGALPQFRACNSVFMNAGTCRMQSLPKCKLALSDFHTACSLSRSLFKIPSTKPGHQLSNCSANRLILLNFDTMDNL